VTSKNQCKHVHGFASPANCPWCQIERLEREVAFMKPLLPPFPGPQDASAPEGYRCSDCAIHGDACVACYSAWWNKQHPNHTAVEPTAVQALPDPAPYAHAICDFVDGGRNVVTLSERAFGDLCHMIYDVMERKPPSSVPWSKRRAEKTTRAG